MKRSGIDKEGLSVHSLRHSCARHLLSGGANLRYDQELLGHQSVASTEVYTEEELENLMCFYRQYHPRENRWYREVEDEYLVQIERLEACMKELLSSRSWLEECIIVNQGVFSIDCIIVK